jgi:hypothetical protein
MNKNRVILIVDRAFGVRLDDLPDSTPIWVVDSALNHPVIVSRREKAKSNPRLGGLTSFQDSPAISSSELAAGMLVTIEEHHGGYSQSPPFCCLTVIGSDSVSRLIESVDEIGFKLVSSNESALEFSRK